MDTTSKLLYLPPELEEVNAAMAAILCASPDEGYVEDIEIEDWVY